MRANYIWALVITVASMSAMAADPSKDEEAIRSIVAESSRGYTERNIDKIMVMYKSEDMLLFDLMPPMVDCCGASHARKKLETFVNGTVGPIVSEFRDLKVKADHDLAYTTALYHFAFTSKEGKKSVIDARITDVWQRIGGGWTVVHEHCSVPAKVTDWM